jgi:hypothetical protein
MLKYKEYVMEASNLEDDKVLQDIRYFRGNFKEFKDWFDKKAGQNTNAYNDYDKKYPNEDGEQVDTQPVYQTFGIVNVPERNKK